MTHASNSGNFGASKKTSEALLAWLKPVRVEGDESGEEEAQDITGIMSIKCPAPATGSASEKRMAKLESICETLLAQLGIVQVMFECPF